MLNEGVSIIICCFNSEKLLQPTLRHIALQETDGDIPIEVILVDNASTDGTQTIAENCWAAFGRSDIKLRIVYEGQPGLSYARHKGADTAAYECLIFCDDDNWLDENYCKNVFHLFNTKPQVGIAGGLGIAEFEDVTLKPDWFDEMKASYAIGDKTNPPAAVNFVCGAGMAIRRSLFLHISSSMPLLLHGRKSKQLTAGEDGELCYRVLFSGYQVYYSPALMFRHFLPSKRLEWAYAKKLHVGFAHSYLILDLYQKAFNGTGKEITARYWLKQAGYYSGIYIKYSLDYYFTKNKLQKKLKEIKLDTWKTIAADYLLYNLKIIRIYTAIVKQKNKLAVK